MRRCQILAISSLFCLGSATLPAAETVAFHKRQSAPGDVLRHTIHCDLDVEISIRQGGQIVQTQRQGFQRLQARRLTIVSVQPDAPTQAHVHYERSTASLQTPGETPEPTPQPVTGKTYAVARRGEDVAITYLDGSVPPTEELEIVAANMQTFGLPNPIAQFFDGRTLRVGQTIRLPTEVARELLGFPDTVRNVTEFQLRLSSIREADKGTMRAAVFDISLAANNPDDASLTMKLLGQMVLEVGTCRTIAVTMSGAVGASELRGPPAGRFEVRSEGTIRVAVQADYGRTLR